MRFALADVLRLLPIESRAIAARQLSVESNPAWLTARAARQLVYQTEGVNPAAAGPLLLQRAALGFVSARAVKAEGATIHSYSSVNAQWEFREWDVPADLWESFAGSAGMQNWELGNFHQRDTQRKNMEYFLLTGVHFLASSVGPASPPLVSTVVASGARGRPPVNEMEGILIDVFADIYEGKFLPTRQSEITKRILERATELEVEIGDTTAKERARKIWYRLFEGEK